MGIISQFGTWISKHFRRQERWPEGQRHLPVIIDRCPICGYTETVCRIAWKEQVENGRISEASANDNVAVSREGVPLIDPRKGPGLSVQVLTISYDLCARCGWKYPVRSEVVMAPVTMKPQQGQPINILGHG